MIVSVRFPIGLSPPLGAPRTRETHMKIDPEKPDDMADEAARKVREYDIAQLIKHGRRVRRIEDITDEEITLIAKSEVPPGYEHLDEELKDWAITDYGLR